MYSSTDNQWNCIFCKISSWDIPPMGDAIIREDEKYMARLSPFPSTIWHTVLIPKKHFDSDVLHMPDMDLQEFIIVAKKVAALLVDKLDDVWRVWLIMEWTGIDHAHIKLLPMHGTWHMKEWIWKQYLTSDTPFTEQYTWYLTSHDWPRMDDESLQQTKNIITN